MSSLNETTQNPSQSMGTLIGVFGIGLTIAFYLTLTIEASTAQIVQEQKDMRTELRQEIKDTRTELKQEIQKVEKEQQATRTELKQDIRDNRLAIKDNQQAIKDNQQAIKDNQQAIKDNQQAIYRTEREILEVKKDLFAFKVEVNTRFDTVEKLLYMIIEDKLSQTEDSPPPKVETEQ